mgnify:CR=1 FL=1
MSRYYTTVRGHNYSRATDRDLAAGNTVYGFTNTEAPKNYVQAGTTRYSNKGGTRVMNIYRYQPPSQTDPNVTKRLTDLTNELNTLRGINEGYKKTIDSLRGDIDALSSANTGYEQDIKGLLGQIATNKTTFDTQLSDAQTAADQRIASLTDQFKIDMEAAAAASKTQLDDLVAANQAALLAEREGFRTDLAARDKQYQSELDKRDLAQQRRDEAAELARVAEAERLEQMRISQETSAANTARSGQSAQFQVGSGGSAPSSSGGIGQFKRRFKITPVTAKGLSIAANKKVTNKMLNV